MTMPAEAFINMTGIAYMAQTQNAIQVAANAGLSGDQIVAMLGAKNAGQAALQAAKPTVVVEELPTEVCPCTHLYAYTHRDPLSDAGAQEHEGPGGTDAQLACEQAEAKGLSVAVESLSVAVESKRGTML